ncbi:MAG: transposase [Candidatus Syntrophoarchaeum caldarius]|uniref:Transposase n=1 Tax=Candidatus Syntropharchaeum caldarium TaxID=1838285 RepID=A0A1F2P8L4_9EURY|nr:MAG: transposase [Candidatus Syntrophoarchaeum caldarius]
MKFEELTEKEWELIEPLLPPPAPTGRPRADDKKTLNAILYVLTTGCRWMDMPGEYGSYVTTWRRLKRWEEEGVWDIILQDKAHPPHAPNVRLSVRLVLPQVGRRGRGDAIPLMR